MIAAQALFLGNNRSQENVAGQAGVSQAGIAKANLVLEWAPELAGQVAGGGSLNQDLRDSRGSEAGVRAKVFHERSTTSRTTSDRAASRCLDGSGGTRRYHRRMTVYDISAPHDLRVPMGKPLMTTEELDAYFANSDADPDIARILLHDVERQGYVVAKIAP